MVEVWGIEPGNHERTLLTTFPVEGFDMEELRVTVEFLAGFGVWDFEVRHTEG